MSFLGYNKGETLEFNYKKACGLWLIAVAFVIALATVVVENKSSICRSSVSAIW